MNQRGIVHPDLTTHLGAQFYPQLVTFQQATETADAYGQPTQTWATVSGLVSLAGRVAPVMGRQESRQPTMVVTTGTHIISLEGYYPSITTSMRAVVDSIGYDVLAVAHDANHRTTWCECEVVSA
jgi:head-tail adaptor